MPRIKVIHYNSQGKPQGWANTPSLTYKVMQFEELTERSHERGHNCGLCNIKGAT